MMNYVFFSIKFTNFALLNLRSFYGIKFWTNRNA